MNYRYITLLIKIEKKKYSLHRKIKIKFKNGEPD